MKSPRRQRASVLLEVVVAIAVFVAAATVLLGLARDSIAAVNRAEERELAVDLARDGMARVATGELTLADLRAGRIEPAETGRVDGNAPESPFASRFRVDVRTQRSPFKGLILVELRVFDAAAPRDSVALCTLRQLVRTARSASHEGQSSDDDEGGDDSAPADVPDPGAAP